MSETNETKAPQGPPCFDASKRFSVPVLSGTRKVCIVRFPTDAEWCERARKERSVVRLLGRGKSEAETVDTSALDLELFERIRCDAEGAPFDASDAAAVLAKLQSATLVSCDREGDNFRVKLKAPGALVEHLVRMPTRKEMDRHEAASAKPINARRAREIRVFLEPTGELYDAIVKSTSGYAGAVPIVHKTAVISEIFVAMAEEDEEAEALPEQ